MKKPRVHLFESISDADEMLDLMGEVLEPLRIMDSSLFVATLQNERSHRDVRLPINFGKSKVLAFRNISDRRSFLFLLSHTEGKALGLDRDKKHTLREIGGVRYGLFECTVEQLEMDSKAIKNAVMGTIKRVSRRLEEKRGAHEGKHRHELVQLIFEPSARTGILGKLELCPPRREELTIELAEEIQATEVDLREGRAVQVTVNAYERNAKARDACVQAHGVDCAICGFAFGKVYGDEFARFIHVHHLKPLSKASMERVVDPKSDLIPVCPNCHAVLHFGGSLRSPDVVRSMLKR